VWVSMFSFLFSRDVTEKYSSVNALGNVGGREREWQTRSSDEVVTQPLNHSLSLTFASR